MQGSQKQTNKKTTQEKVGKRGVTGGKNPLSPSFSPSAVRSNLIPSPPTYNIAHDYISWESFSNVSYYTRILPSVPRDCPTPMGTKGNGDGVRGLSLGWVTGDALFPLGKSNQKSNDWPISQMGAPRQDMQEPGMRTGVGKEDRKRLWEGLV